MKKTFTLLLIALHFSVVCYGQQQTHDYIAIKTPGKDTAGTIFGHITWEATPKILFHLPPEDSFLNLDPLMPDTHFPIQHLYRDSFRILLRFPGRGWVELGEKKVKREVAGYGPYPDFAKVEILRGDPYMIHLYRISLRLELVQFFNRYPNIFEEIQTGTILEIQASMQLQADSLPFEWIYSNIDSIYLPPATSDDIMGFHYLQSHPETILAFSRFSGYSEFSYDGWVHVRDNFKNSIISDFADYYSLEKQYTENRNLGDPIVNEEYKQLRILQFKKLRNSGAAPI